MFQRKKKIILYVLKATVGRNLLQARNIHIEHSLSNALELNNEFIKYVKWFNTQNGVLCRDGQTYEDYFSCVAYYWTHCTQTSYIKSLTAYIRPCRRRTEALFPSLKIHLHIHSVITKWAHKKSILGPLEDLDKGPL